MATFLRGAASAWRRLPSRVGGLRAKSAAAVVLKQVAPVKGWSGRSSGGSKESGDWFWKAAGASAAAASTAVTAASADGPAAPGNNPGENKRSCDGEKGIGRAVALAGRRLLTSVTAEKGHRSYMEDESFVSKDGSFSAIFDGHGGEGVSKFLLQNLYRYFVENLPAAVDSVYDLSTVERALRDAYRIADANVVKHKPFFHEGSCAVSVTVHSDGNGKASIISCNVGDSRAVLSRRGEAVDLTEDHKPTDPREVERIHRCGGKVTCKIFECLEGFECPEGFDKVCRVNGKLAVARAIGDADTRPGVSGEADIRTLEVNRETDEFVILASDGLWDVMTSEEAVKFVHSIMGDAVGAGKEAVEGGRATFATWTVRYGQDKDVIRAVRTMRKKNMSEYLADEALRRGSMDNTSVTVVWLK